MKITTIILMYFTFAFFSCSDPCKDVVCGPNGACDEGVCICNSGFSGSNCEIADRDVFLSSWQSISRVCDVGNSTPLLYDIAAGDAGDEIKITTMTTPDFLLIGKVDSTIVTIAPQTLVFGIPVVYEGSGVMRNDTLELTISASAENQLVRTCTGDYIMQ